MSRHRPATALALLAVVGVAPLLDAWAGGHLVDAGPSTLVAVVAGYLAGAWLSPVVAAIGCLVAASGLTAANQLAGSTYTVPNDLFFFLLLLGGTALAGALLSARTAQVRELRALTELRRTQRATEVRAASLEERNRVGAEITQALMQRLGAVVVQVSGARVRPERDAMVRIEQAARAALDDLRAALGSLRADEPDHGEAQDVDPDPAVAPVGPVDLLVGACGVAVAVEALADHGPPAAVLAVLIGVPLVWRRRHPLLAVAAAFVVAAGVDVVVEPLSGLVSPLLPFSLGAYAVGAHARGSTRLLGTALMALGCVGVAYAATTAGHSADPSDGLAPTLVWMVVAVLSGAVAQQHAVRAARLHRLMQEMEAGHGGDLRLAAAEQRQSMARDLHDTVAHAMTVVCLHAQAAQRSADPASSLVVVEGAAREAMTRLREGLVALETESGLPDEVRAFASVLGVEVEVRVGADLHGPALLLARRVVREALVNAVRHAPGAPVTVTVLGADPVELSVTNPSGPATGGAGFAGGSGSGLTGLAELLVAHGGRLERGPLPGGGFRVVAYVPQAAPVPA